MEQIPEHIVVLFIVGIVALFALGVLFSFAVKLSDEKQTNSVTDITGAAILTAKEKAAWCKTAYYDKPTSKGITHQLYGSQWPDQCYEDRSAVAGPTNNGRYLREYSCEDNEITFTVYDCGSNKCQFGACITSNYVKLG